MKTYKKGKEDPLDFKALQNELAEETLPRVILMHGTERYLMRWMTEQIVSRYVDETAGLFDYTAMEAFRLDTSAGIIDACEMMPMMSEKRVVCVTDLNPKCRDLDVLAAYLPRVPDSTILIFIQEEAGRLGKEFSAAVRKAGRAYEFSTVDRRTLAGFIRKYFRQEGAAFQPEAVDALIDISGYYDKDSGRTLDNIRADVSKAAAHSSGTVTAEDVTEAVIPNEERDAFAFTDALTAGNKAEALKMLRILLSYGDSEFTVLGLICSQFEAMMMIREASEIGRPVSFLKDTLKLNQYRVSILSRPASRYTSAQLKEILMKAYEVDRNIKTGTMEAASALELFVAEV